MEGSINYKITVTDKDNYDVVLTTYSPADISVILNMARTIIDNIEDKDEKVENTIEVLTSGIQNYFKETMEYLKSLN